MPSGVVTSRSCTQESHRACAAIERSATWPIGVSAGTQLFGRWGAYARSLYDLELDEFRTYGFGLRRTDHDWSIALNIGYNPFTEETSFRLDFEPRIGGMSRRREDRFGGSELHDTGLAARY